MKALALECQAPDAKYVDEMAAGFPVESIPDRGDGTPEKQFQQYH